MDAIEQIFREVALMRSHPAPDQDPFQSKEYDRFVESTVPLCHCRESNRPCDGVLAGGICDGIEDEPLDGDDDERDWDFNDRETFQT